MTRKQSDIAEAKIEVFERDGYTCQWCGKAFQESQLEVAHHIMKGSINRSKSTSYRYVKNWLWREYNFDASLNIIDLIIHHKYNMSTSCKKHNDNFNIFYNPEKRDKLLKKIWNSDDIKAVINA